MSQEEFRDLVAETKKQLEHLRVLGVEGTFAGSTIKGSLTNTTFGVGFDDVFETRINSLATVTGRVGYAFNNWLPYIKGGYAGANVKFSVSDTAGANQGSGSETKWHNGWTIGAGLEYGLTRNWIIGVEYDFNGHRVPQALLSDGSQYPLQLFSFKVR